MPPKRGWSKRHYNAAKRRGDEVRRQGGRALYNDTVRWYARRKNMSFQQAAADATFQELWRIRRGLDKEQRLLALEELGILTQDGDGKWRYSDAFMAWLFEET